MWTSGSLLLRTPQSLAIKTRDRHSGASSPCGQVDADSSLSISSILQVWVFLTRYPYDLHTFSITKSVNSWKRKWRLVISAPRSTWPCLVLPATHSSQSFRLLTPSKGVGTVGFYDASSVADVMSTELFRLFTGIKGQATCDSALTIWIDKIRFI